MKEFLISLLHYFVDITTAVLIATAIYLTASGKQIDSSVLWQILLSGFITALPSAALICLDNKTEKLSWILWILHFCVIYGVSLVLLHTFGWCRITPLSALLTFFAVVFIYLFTCMVHYLIDKKHTTLMNEQLKKRYLRTEQGQKESV